jgi:hypothetical protein
MQGHVRNYPFLTIWLPEDPPVNEDENYQSDDHDQSYFGGDLGGAVHGLLS